MFDVNKFIENASSETISMVSQQIQNIKEICTAVRNRSKTYFVPNDTRCVYLKIYVDGSDIGGYNWIFQPATHPYIPREIYLDIFGDYTSYRLSTLPEVSMIDKLTQQDDHVYLIMRNSIQKTISSKDSITASNKFPIITLCGSTKFKEDFIKAQKDLTLKGYIVISVGLFGHSGDEEVWEGNNKEMLDVMHKEKIRMADAIYVINKDGYIGESTKKEIEFAKELGKEVLYMY